MLILLKAFHTLHIFLVEFNRFPEPVAFIQDFLTVLKNARIKFQVFQDPYVPCEKHGRRICHFQANLSSYNIAPVEIDKD